MTVYETLGLLQEIRVDYSGIINGSETNEWFTIVTWIFVVDTVIFYVQFVFIIIIFKNVTSNLEGIASFWSQ